FTKRGQPAPTITHFFADFRPVDFAVSFPPCGTRLDDGCILSGLEGGPTEIQLKALGSGGGLLGAVKENRNKELEDAGDFSLARLLSPDRDLGSLGIVGWNLSICTTSVDRFLVSAASSYGRFRRFHG